jgi:hypothetical protein
MAANINRFRGTWYIHWITGIDLILNWGWKIVIGTGERSTQTPFVGHDGEVCTGFVIYERIGHDHWTFYTSSNEWGPLHLIDGQLRWAGLDKDDQPLRIYLSVAEGVAEGENGPEPFVSLYGSTLRDDPDQVAVWGANDGPPNPEPV